MSLSKDQIFNQLKDILKELFEIDPDTVTLETRLFEELDLDSIDAIDLIAHLQKITKRRFNPEEFKSVRTVSDVVDVIHSELSK